MGKKSRGKTEKALNTWLRQVCPSTGSPNAHGLCQAKVAKGGVPYRGKRKKNDMELGCPFIQGISSLQQRPVAL